jgi:calcium/calmodulin-dependent protein kinase (CaM kinase) II
MNENDPTVRELIEKSRQLLESIAAADWLTYAELCDPTLSAFEPESRGLLVEGMPFHRFYFELGSATGPRNITLTAPKVRLLGDDVAVVTYVRLEQRLDDGGLPVTGRFEETRVWHRRDGRWRHVHFHRSAMG